MPSFFRLVLSQLVGTRIVPIDQAARKRYATALGRFSAWVIGGRRTTVEDLLTAVFPNVAEVRDLG